MTPTVSVIIPTHSPNRDRLAQTLVALGAQTLPPAEWELLVVDNASPEPVPLDLARRGHPEACVVRETELGLTPARLAGIARASGTLLVFVDDDNVLQANYLAQAKDLLEQHPDVAVAGGLIEGRYAVAPPPWAQDHLWSLAVRDYGNELLISQFSPVPDHRAWPIFSPVGAGMVVRKAAALRYVNHCTQAAGVLSDRKGASLASAGDCELLMHAAFLNGGQVAYSPALRLTHLMPAGRLRFSYLVRLNYQAGVSWGQFQVHYDFKSRISRLSLLLCLLRAFLRRSAWTRRGFIAWAATAGEFVGRATSPSQRRTGSAK